MNHDAIWTAIENFANYKRMSVSGLARRAGLDATTFNKSKRVSPNGQPRWPSTKSLALILMATDSNLTEFAKFIPTKKEQK